VIVFPSIHYRTFSIEDHVRNAPPECTDDLRMFRKEVFQRPELARQYLEAARVSYSASDQDAADAMWTDLVDNVLQREYDRRGMYLKK
jgi:hypothetical protein